MPLLPADTLYIPIQTSDAVSCFFESQSRNSFGDLKWTGVTQLSFTTALILDAALFFITETGGAETHGALLNLLAALSHSPTECGLLANSSGLPSRALRGVAPLHHCAGQRPALGGPSVCLLFSATP